MFLAQIAVNTKSYPAIHSSTLLDSGAFVVVIDGRPIASGKIIEESEPVRVFLNILACVEISFNIVSSPEHPIVGFTIV